MSKLVLLPLMLLVPACATPGPEVDAITQESERAQMVMPLFPLPVGGGAQTPPTLGQVSLCDSGALTESCVQPGPVPAPSADPAELLIEVDPQVTPAQDMAPLDDGAPRPMAALVDASGVPVRFVENELILVDPDDALLVELGAQIVAVDDPAAFGLDGPRTLLVRVEPGVFDAPRLAGELRAVDARARGRYRVSSERAGALLSAAARTQASGRTVGLNFVGAPAGYADKVLADAPSAPSVGGYFSNAFKWPHMLRGGLQNIGVAEAWRVLSLAGKLVPSVEVAVIDGGFAPDADFPPFSAFSMISGVAATGSENPGKCGGEPCPWHGTNVVHAGFGLPNNAFGVAGPGGPVARLQTVHNSYDVFSNIASITFLRVRGARIINMSFRARVPALVSFAVGPFDIATAMARSSGALLFAAAGNDGENVDEEDCFGVCWEEAWHAPCENNGVICVGGLNGASNLKAAKSNHGPSVDIWGPFFVYGGTTPDGKIGPRIVGGTSVASPFVAGVAALVWAAEPSLSADQVENTLFTTANTSPDPSVNRIVNAYEAVKWWTGNVPPVITITAPTTGTSVSYGGLNTVTLIATTNDVEDGADSGLVEWRSDLEGDLGTGASVAHIFTVRGVHTISATVTDSSGASRARHISLTVVNDAPVPEILAPGGFWSMVDRGAPVAFLGRGVDRNELGVACERLAWTIEGTTYGGCAPTVVLSGLGWVYVTLRATDELGVTAETGKYLLVQEPVPGLPVVSITSPGEGGGVWGHSYNLVTGTATDPDGEAIVSYTWTVIDRGVRTSIGAGATLSWRPSNDLDDGCGGRDVQLELTATDASGQVGKATRTVFINWPVC